MPRASKGTTMPRASKPTALKKLEGVRKDRVNDREPTSPPGLGPPTDRVAQDPVAVEAWGYLVAALPAEVARRSDRLAAELFALTYSAWQKCRDLFAVEGPVIVDSSERGEVTKGNPAATIMATFQKQLLDQLKQFGLTPSARAGLAVTSEGEVDQLLQFVRDRQGQQNRPPVRSEGDGAATA